MQLLGWIIGRNQNNQSYFDLAKNQLKPFIIFERHSNDICLHVGWQNFKKRADCYVDSYQHTVVIAIEKLSNSVARPVFWINRQGDHICVVMLLINAPFHNNSWITYAKLQLIELFLLPSFLATIHIATET